VTDVQKIVKLLKTGFGALVTSVRTASLCVQLSRKSPCSMNMISSRRATLSWRRRSVIHSAWLKPLFFCRNRAFNRTFVIRNIYLPSTSNKNAKFRFHTNFRYISRRLRSLRKAFIPSTTSSTEDTTFYLKKVRYWRNKIYILNKKLQHLCHLNAHITKKGK
jgi:hypothetical protein